MGTQERRERERTALRQKIIDKGREILVSEGHAALTMRRLADEIEYTPGALYVHFADKETLVRAICHTDFLAFAKNFSIAMKVGDAIERLRQLARSYARFALEHPAQYRILFVLDPTAGMKDMSLIERGNPEEDAYAALELAIQKAIEDGHFPGYRERPHLLAQTFWAGLHGVVSIEIRRTEEMPIPFEEVSLRVQTMCEGLLAGLGARGVAPVAASSGERAAKPKRAAKR